MGNDSSSQLEGHGGNDDETTVDGTSVFSYDTRETGISGISGMSRETGMSSRLYRTSSRTERNGPGNALSGVFNGNMIDAICGNSFFEDDEEDDDESVYNRGRRRKGERSGSRHDKRSSDRKEREKKEKRKSKSKRRSNRDDNHDDSYDSAGSFDSEEEKDRRNSKSSKSRKQKNDLRSPASDVSFERSRESEDKPTSSVSKSLSSEHNYNTIAAKANTTKEKNSNSFDSDGSNTPGKSSALTKPLASSFAKRCYFTKAGIGKNMQHYEGVTLTGNTVLMLASAMKLKGCPTICDEDLRRVEQTYPNQFSRLPDELLLSSGWRRISKYCHFSGKPIPDGVPFFHSQDRCHPNGGYYFLLAASIGMETTFDVEPLTLDMLILLQTDFPTQCDQTPRKLIDDPTQWTLVTRFCFFSGGPINSEEDVYYNATFNANPIYMLAFLSPNMTPEELYRLHDITGEYALKSVAAVEEVEAVYDLSDRDFDDLKMYHLGPCRALTDHLLTQSAWEKVLPQHFMECRENALARAFEYEVHAQEAIAKAGKMVGRTQSYESLSKNNSPVPVQYPTQPSISTLQSGNVSKPTENNDDSNGQNSYVEMSQLGNEKRDDDISTEVDNHQLSDPPATYETPQSSDVSKEKKSPVHNDEPIIRDVYNTANDAENHHVTTQGDDPTTGRLGTNNDEPNIKNIASDDNESLNLEACIEDEVDDPTDDPTFEGSHIDSPTKGLNRLDINDDSTEAEEPIIKVDTKQGNHTLNETQSHESALEDYYKGLEDQEKNDDHPDDEFPSKDDSSQILGGDDDQMGHDVLENEMRRISLDSRSGSQQSCRQSKRNSMDDNSLGSSQSETKRSSYDDQSHSTRGRRAYQDKEDPDSYNCFIKDVPSTPTSPESEYVSMQELDPGLSCDLQVDNAENELKDETRFATLEASGFGEKSKPEIFSHVGYGFAKQVSSTPRRLDPSSPKYATPSPRYSPSQKLIRKVSEKRNVDVFDNPLVGSIHDSEASTKLQSAPHSHSSTGDRHDVGSIEVNVFTPQPRTGTPDSYTRGSSSTAMKGARELLKKNRQERLALMSKRKLVHKSPSLKILEADNGSVGNENKEVVKPKKVYSNARSRSITPTTKRFQLSSSPASSPTKKVSSSPASSPTKKVSSSPASSPTKKVFSSASPPPPKTPPHTYYYSGFTSPKSDVSGSSAWTDDTEDKNSRRALILKMAKNRMRSKKEINSQS